MAFLMYFQKMKMCIYVFLCFYISQTLCYFITKRFCTMVCGSKEIPVKQYNLDLHYALGFHFFPTVYSPFSKLVNQIKKESKHDPL